MDQDSTEIRITQAPTLGVPIPRPKADVPKLAEKLPTDGLYSSFAKNWYEKALDWVADKITWTRFFASITWQTTTFYVRLKMTNDKKATILGWVKGILSTALTVFVGDKLIAHGGAEGVAGVVAVVIGGVWSLVEVVQGFFTNKPDK